MDGGASPGWYHDGAAYRWWDGSNWGPYAPPPGWQDPRSDEAGKTLAILAHLGSFFGGFILPLVIYLTQRDRNRFATEHAREATNFQLTVMVAWLAMFVLFIPLTIVSAAVGKANAFPWPIFAIFPLFFIVMIGAWIFGIIGAVRAGRLEEWRYPIRIPFFRDHALAR